MKKRPDELTGKTRRIKTGCGNIYVTINNHENKPFEVFIKLGKAGGCSASYTEALARIISVALRSGADIKEIADKLKSIGCNAPIIGGSQSCADAVSKLLTEEEKPIFDEKFDEALEEHGIEVLS